MTRFSPDARAGGNANSIRLNLRYPVVRLAKICWLDKDYSRVQVEDIAHKMESPDVAESLVSDVANHMQRWLAADWQREVSVERTRSPVEKLTHRTSADQQTIVIHYLGLQISAPGIRIRCRVVITVCNLPDITGKKNHSKLWCRFNLEEVDGRPASAVHPERCGQFFADMDKLGRALTRDVVEPVYQTVVADVVGVGFDQRKTYYIRVYGTDVSDGPIRALMRDFNVGRLMRLASVATDSEYGKALVHLFKELGYTQSTDNAYFFLPPGVERREITEIGWATIPGRTANALYEYIVTSDSIVVTCLDTYRWTAADTDSPRSASAYQTTASLADELGKQDRLPPLMHA